MKKLFSFVLKAFLSVGLIYLAVNQLDFDILFSFLLKMNAWWLAASLVVLTVSYCLGALQWQWILRISRFDLGYAKVLGYYYVGLFFNNFLISGMGGDFLRVYDIKKYGDENQGLSPAMASVILDRFVGLMALIILASVSGIFVLGKGESTGLFAAILFLLFSSIFVIALLLHKPIADRTVKPLARRIPKGLYAKLQSLYYAMNRFRHEPAGLLRIGTIAVSVQSMRIFSIFAIGRALGDESSSVYYLLFVPMISLAASLPISIGGTGPREQTTVFLFRKIGVARELAFSIGFITYLISAFSTIPGAIIFLFRKHART